jgi:hypothetical protein
MATSQKQQAERNITKHKNYIKFLRNHYLFKTIEFEAEFLSVVKMLIKLERKKK